MRVLAYLLAFVAVLVVAYLAYGGIVALSRGRTPPRMLRPGGRWQPHHYADDGETVVVVACLTPGGEVIEEHIVARIPDADDDWSDRFLRAMDEARERAFHLNADDPS